MGQRVRYERCHVRAKEHPLVSPFIVQGGGTVGRFTLGLRSERVQTSAWDLVRAS